MKQWRPTKSSLVLIAAGFATAEVLRVVAKEWCYAQSTRSKTSIYTLALLPAEILLLISHELSVRDLCALEEVRLCARLSSAIANMINPKVSSAMRHKMREPSIWLTALRDVWAVKARPFRPSTTGLSVAQIKKLLLREIHLEARLSSVFQPRLVRDVRLEGRPQHTRFVPGTGGNYVIVCRDGRTELRSLMGELLDVVQDADDAPPPLNVRVVPVSAHSANVIVVHAVNKCVVPIVCHHVLIY
jgi:hypothetical protein